MFKVNEYFEGRVKSIAFTSEDGPATIGVMAKGEYEFGTSTIEHMIVVSGELSVRLPNTNGFQSFYTGESFIVDADCKFQVVAVVESSYLCKYM